jgi:hypothetical protein
MGKIAHHLAGHHLRKGRHALGRHAVIRGEHTDPHLLHGWPSRALQTGQTDRQRFERAERPRRLGQLSLMFPRLLLTLRIDGLAGIK